MKNKKSWLILPTLTFSINEDGSKEILLGWLTEVLSFKF
jgi:hypothetical protein